jgi:hypothetical protein
MNSAVDTATEARDISLELTALSKGTINAVQTRDVAAIYKIIPRRSTLIKRLCELAKIAPDILKQCAELVEAAKLEQEALSVLRSRHACLGAELDHIEQQIKLNQAYL